MTALTKQEAATLWGNGFKLHEVLTGDEYIIDSVFPNEFSIANNKQHILAPFSQVGSHFKIIARPLSQLTEEIEHEGSYTVPCKEMFEKTVGGIWNDDFCGYKIIHNRIIVSNSLDKFTIDIENKCFTYESLDPDGDGFWNPPFDQPALFAYMDSLHFDRFNWKERGLTVNK